jgi:hypothetical protein
MNDFAVLSTLVTDFRKQLNTLLVREATRHMMDCHLDFHTLEALEEHLIPALDAVEDALDWEPTDADLADYRA